MTMEARFALGIVTQELVSCSYLPETKRAIVKNVRGEGFKLLVGTLVLQHSCPPRQNLFGRR